ncbi:MAG: chemotaxis protein CheX [Candidatus Aquicultor sp.]
MSQLAGGLTPKQKDMLERIIKLSTDSSAVALSEMTDKAIFLESPRLDIVTLESVVGITGGAEVTAVSVFLMFEGEINGNMLLVFPGDSAFKLIDIVMREDRGGIQELDEMGTSVLGEIGNLVSAYFLSTLSDYTGLDLRPSSPMVAEDMVGAIISSAVMTLERAPEEILYIETEIADETSKIEGYLMLFTDEDSLGSLLRAIETR